MGTRGTDERAALRVEHDRIAEEIGTRTSVDHVQNGGVLAFFSFIAFGLTVKLGWDRWGWLPVHKPPPPPGLPMWFLLAMLGAAVLIGYTVREFRRGRALRMIEDQKFKRLLALRKELGLDT